MPGSVSAVVRRGVVIACLAAGTLGLSSCGSFFQCEGKADCGTTGTGTGGTGSGDYAYVSNSATGSSYVNAYDIGSGALTAIGSPANLSYVPAAMVVAPSNGYMYIGNATGSIYLYTIGTSGALSIANGGNPVGTSLTGLTSMDVSPDGKWLFASDDVGLSLYEFPITVSSGALGSPATFAISGAGSAAPTSVRVSPNENYVACSLGLDGTILFPYDSNDGITTNSFASISTGAQSVSDFSVVMDTNDYLYIARTTGPVVYKLTTPSSNVVNAALVTQSSLTNGNGPHAIALSTDAGGVVFLGNTGDLTQQVVESTIFSYTQSAGALKDVTTTGYVAPTATLALQADKTGKYLIAAGYNSTSGIQIYTIGTGGVLTAGGSAGSGTTLTGIPALIAVTH